jgi:hypothetical protein
MSFVDDFISDPFSYIVNPTLAFSGATLDAGVEAGTEAIGEVTGANDLVDQQQQMLEEQRRNNLALENMLAEEQRRQQQELDTAAANAARRARNRSEIAGAGGRNSTVLTSPLGLTDNAQTRTPTLLGA